MRGASRGRWAEREASPCGRIGEILVSQGFLSGEQLQAALEVKKKDPRRIGKILLSLGFVSQRFWRGPRPRPGVSSTLLSLRETWTRRRYCFSARRR